ncbi:MAG: NAD(P)-binding domain-containing protein, partial [Flavobacterium sp.]
MIRITIIGSGNVAQHLILAFAKSNQIEVSQVFSRKKDALSHLIDSSKITDNFNSLVEADLYIIAVSDDAISEISSQLPFENRLVVHTSGSVTIDSLDSKNRKGVFYPLQTFSKTKAVDFSTIPICLESDQETDYELLEKISI